MRFFSSPNGHVREEAVVGEGDCLFPQDRKIAQGLPLECLENMMFYPMFLAAWDILMGLRVMEAHQVLRFRGQLTEWAPSLAGRVVFISHEWLGFRHPDPDGVHLRALQRLLRCVDEGKFVAELTPVAELSGFPRVRAGGAHWKALMPRCFFWLDYAGIPQLLGEASLAQLSSDHRCSASNDMELAVRSIPAYVEASNLVIVLTPYASHHDVAGRVCNYDSWSRRGWCRVEALCARLARQRVRLLICDGRVQPAEFSIKGWNSPPGLGEFTCCSTGHMQGGRVVPCDKANLRDVVSRMFRAAAEYAWTGGQPDRMRFLLCREGYWLQGFPPMPADRSPLAFTREMSAFRARLCWDETNEKVPHPRRSRDTEGPWTLLHWAALTGSAALVREILLEDGSAGVNALCRPIKEEAWTQWSTPLSLASVASNDGFDAADVLINARADPEQRVWTGSRSPKCLIPLVTLVAVFGNVGQLERWLSRFPHHVNAPSLVLGRPLYSVLTIFLGHCPTCDERFRVFQSFGADLRFAGMVSDSPLLWACRNTDEHLAAVRSILEARSDVNVRMVSRSWLLRSFGIACCWATQLQQLCGRRPSHILSLVASLAGTTPLHCAADIGNVEIVRLLVQAKAHAQRNCMGLTPLQTAMRRFSGTPPEALIELLGEPTRQRAREVVGHRAQFMKEAAP